jgi:hypothetical protein
MQSYHGNIIHTVCTIYTYALRITSAVVTNASDHVQKHAHLSKLMHGVASELAVSQCIMLSHTYNIEFFVLKLTRCNVTVYYTVTHSQEPWVSQW